MWGERVPLLNFTKKSSGNRFNRFSIWGPWGPIRIPIAVPLPSGPLLKVTTEKFISNKSERVGGEEFPVRGL